MRIRHIVIALLALLLAAPAEAQEQVLHWERYDVDVEITPSAELRVAEEHRLVIDSGTFRFGSRTIELRSGESIRDVAVSESGQPYRQGAETPGGYQVSEESGRVQIKYWFADTSADEHSMLISYRVLGAVEGLSDDEARLQWQAYANNPFPVDAGEVRISLPGGPDSTDIRYANRGSGTGGRLQGSTVVYSVSNLRARQQPLDATVTFPRTVLTSSASLRMPAIREQPRNPAPVGRQPVEEQPGLTPAPQPSEGSGLMSLVCCLVLFFVMSIVIRSVFVRGRRTVMPPNQTGWGGYPPNSGYPPNMGRYGYPRRRSGFGGLGGFGALLPWILMRPRSGYNSPQNPDPYGQGQDPSNDGFAGGSWGDSSSSSNDGFAGGSWGDSSSSSNDGFAGGSWGDSGGGGSSDSGGGGSSDFG